MEGLHREIEVIAELSRKAIYENAHVAVDQKEWHARNNGYLERHRRALKQVDRLEGQKRERKNKSLMLEGFIRGLETQPLVLEEFDEKLWAVAVEKVKVKPDGELVFELKDGIVIDR